MMLEYLILYISSDLEKAKALSLKLDLASNVRFIFIDSAMEALSILSEKEIRLILLQK